MRVKVVGLDQPSASQFVRRMRLRYCFGYGLSPPPTNRQRPQESPDAAMHLLHVGTRKLEEFFDPVPAYAVLSHTWDAEEVTFQDVVTGSGNGGGAVAAKRGFAKLDGCCEQAARDGLDYVWIDTCCIDKTSSAELSEAINSMFAWYAGARVCYVYLADVDAATDGPPEAAGSAFRRSRWFTRGWTLQELIAPRERRFFARDWAPVRFGARAGAGPGRGPALAGVVALPRLLEEITGVPHALLSRGFADVAAFPAAARLAWAAARATTRPEDRAYCLLGLLGVHLPLLYGEGGARAFFRLQHALVQDSSDPTLLCWASRRLVDDEGQLLAWTGALAPSPAWFRGCGAQGRDDVDRPVVAGRWAGQPSRPEACLPVQHSLMTNRGLLMHMPIHVADKERGVILAAVDAYHGRESQDRLALPLVRSRHSSNVFYRLPGGRPIRLSGDPTSEWDRQWIYLGLKDHCPDPFAPVGAGDDFWWVDLTGPLCASDGPWRFDGLYPHVPAAKERQAIRLGYARLVELPDDLLLVFSNPWRTLLLWFHVASTAQRAWRDGSKTVPRMRVSIAETENPDGDSGPADTGSQRLSQTPIAHVIDPGSYRVDFQRALARHEWSDATEMWRTPRSDDDPLEDFFEQKFKTKLGAIKLNMQFV